ncbi:uncharacterized protein [Coffea arabica]|uniref:Reverse transcriptase zinc-binding domain-containing protein n=1 Tax=Coffea arabica TaxID=13443 RepID=A0A6P6S5G5_COFAR|nr:uncharacterized protein LOC113687691 [Coffea arabica]
MVLEKHFECKVTDGRGVRKRVGDGKTIDIWKDRWIPGVAGVKDTKDRLFWAHSASGEYTVKSGYRSAQERKIGRRVRNSHEESGCRNEGILPVNENIKAGSMQGNPLCKCCEVCSESTEHMLFLCNHAEAIWKMAPIQWDGLESLRGKFWLWWSELVEATVREKGEEHITFTVNLLWQIWKDRNEINFNGKGRAPGVVVHKALTEWLEYQEIQGEGMEEERELRQRVRKQERWAAPDKGWIKLNTNAALNQQTNKAGWGIVARDWKGKLVATLACPSFTYSAPILEEALAIRTAMVKLLWKAGKGSL